MTKQRYVDFKFVRAQADFLMVLAHYGIAIEGQGVQRQALCPFHADKKPSLKVNLGRKIFHCFGCEASGNIIEFVRLKEGLDDDELRAAAGKLADICSIPVAPPKGKAVRRATRPVEAGLGPETTKEPSSPRSPSGEAPGASAEASDESAVNQPLSPEFVERFEGKLVREHPYLLERKLGPEIVETFGLGVFPADQKGMMRGRLCIPIHDERGRLLAYAGRWALGDDVLPEGEDRYKLPPKFYKSHVLYNLHRVKHLVWRGGFLVLVEGFFSVFVLHELGLPSVALMGRSLSARQLELLTTLRAKRVTLLLDGDEPGRSATAEIGAQLANAGILSRALFLPDSAQPDTWLRMLAERKVRFSEWLEAMHWP